MLKWYVYLENINGRNIVTYNVFKHFNFYQDVKEAIKQIENRQDFSERIRQIAKYYFWSKCEYEILVTSWIMPDTFKDKKIDVYDQLELNWDRFIDYIWENKKEILKNEI